MHELRFAQIFLVILEYERAFPIFGAISDIIECHRSLVIFEHGVPVYGAGADVKEFCDTYQATHSTGFRRAASIGRAGGN